MRKRVFLVAAVGMVAILAAGGLFASNMGFKLNYLLEGPAAAPQNGTNTLALPFNQQTNLVDAFVLAQDINASPSCSGGNCVVSVSRYVASADGLQTYVPGAGTAFALTPGEGYRVQLNENVDYIVVGSHDPGLALTLLGPGAPPQNGTNDYAYPYHSTAADAFQLATQINAAPSCGSGNCVVSVSKYVKSADGLQTYVPGAGTAFALTPGESYRIQVNTNVTFTPSHY